MKQKNSIENKGIVYLIGAGPGDPGLITVKGREILRKCDTVVYDHLASEALLSETRPGCRKIYVGKQAGHHSAKQEEINKLLVRLAEEGRKVARLKGGDPFVFGRGGEEIQALEKAGARWMTVPGVTSAVAVPECAGIPVTHRALSRSFHVITAHGKDEDMDYLNFPQLAALEGTLVFLMGLGRLPRLVAGLMEAGKDGSCPAAVIENGSLSCQRTVRGTLNTIAQKALEAGLHTPAVIVVGKTAELDFSWEEKIEPKIQRAGVVGTDSFCCRMEQRLSDYQIRTRRIGGLTIRSLLEQNGQRIYSALKNSTVLAFTSANGVKLFFQGLLSRGMDGRSLSHMKIAAVGDGTEEKLGEYGILADWKPERYTTRDLALLLGERCGSEDHVLVPRSADGSRQLNQVLNERNISYDDVPIYCTEERAVDRSCLDGLDYLIFGSASGVEAFFRQMKKIGETLPEGLPVAAIGPYTSEALKKNGISFPLQPDVFTTDELARAVWEDMNKITL